MKIAVFAVGRDAYTDVVMAFPLVDDRGNLVTNWALKQSFALFLRNSLYVLGNIRDEVRAESATAGEPIDRLKARNTVVEPLEEDDDVTVQWQWTGGAT